MQLLQYGGPIKYVSCACVFLTNDLQKAIFWLLKPSALCMRLCFYKPREHINEFYALLHFSFYFFFFFFNFVAPLKSSVFGFTNYDLNMYSFYCMYM